MALKGKSLFSFALLASVFFLSGCITYSFTGVSTTASTIKIDQFFNNSDLAPANLGATFTNRLKDYYLQNSALKIVAENGDLSLEGVVSEYRLNPIAPTANQTPGSRVTPAALTRLTISVKVNYIDARVPKSSFKDKSFSFYQDFENTLNFQTIQEDLEKKIFDQILLDIFNATIANW